MDLTRIFNFERYSFGRNAQSAVFESCDTSSFVRFRVAGQDYPSVSMGVVSERHTAPQFVLGYNVNSNTFHPIFSTGTTGMTFYVPTRQSDLVHASNATVALLEGDHGACGPGAVRVPILSVNTYGELSAIRSEPLTLAMLGGRNFCNVHTRPGTYGSGVHGRVPVVQVNALGQVTDIAHEPIAFPSTLRLSNVAMSPGWYGAGSNGTVARICVNNLGQVVDARNDGVFDHTVPHVRTTRLNASIATVPTMMTERTYCQDALTLGQHVLSNIATTLHLKTPHMHVEGHFTAANGWGGTGSAAGVLGGSVHAFVGETHDGDAGLSLRFAGPGNRPSNVRMPFAGAVVAATFCADAVHRPTFWECCINDVSTGRGGALHHPNGATLDWTVQPLRFAAHDRLSWKTTSTPATHITMPDADQVSMTFWVKFD